VARLAVWLSGVVSYEQAATILADVGQIPMSKSSVWRRAQTWGQALQEAEHARAVQANQLPREAIVAGEAKEPERLGAGMDGALLYILGEGWKELKIGCVFAIEQRPTFVPATLEWEELGHAVATSYTAYLGGPERFGQYVWAEASRRGWSRAWETQVLGDGAVWIWNLVGEHFYDSLQVVDWYHATQHLAHAAQLLYGDGDSPAKQRWWHAQKERLFQGQAEGIGHHLQEQAYPLAQGTRDSLVQEAGYFETNKRRMTYWEVREEGWLIGSGMVESGAKQFKHRFTGPGMRWSRPGAERLIPVRSAILSDTFDQFWHAIYNPPKN